MKKLIALLLVTVMLCCTCVCASAEALPDTAVSQQEDTYSMSSSSSSDSDDGSGVIFIIGGAAVGIIIAVCIMLFHKAQLKSVHMERSARNYVEPGSFNITHSDDIYLYKKLDRTAKPKND